MAREDPSLKHCNLLQHRTILSMEFRRPLASFDKFSIRYVIEDVLCEHIRVLWRLLHSLQYSFLKKKVWKFKIKFLIQTERTNLNKCRQTIRNRFFGQVDTCDQHVIPSIFFWFLQSNGRCFFILFQWGNIWLYTLSDKYSLYSNKG